MTPQPLVSQSVRQTATATVNNNHNNNDNNYYYLTPHYDYLLIV